MVPEEIGIAFGHMCRRAVEYFSCQIWKTFTGARIRIQITDKLLVFDAFGYIRIKQHAAQIIDGHVQKSFGHQIQLSEYLSSLL